MAIQICFHSIYSHAQISPKIGPFGPYIGPNDPHGGIFPLGNICFYKLGSDRNLWVPLEFCHQGGAWGPLLPTRLQRLHTTLKENTVMMMVAFNVRKYIVKSCGKASLFLLSTLDLVVAKHSKSNIVLRTKVHPYVANTSNCHELKFVLF